MASLPQIKLLHVIVWHALLSLAVLLLGRPVAGSNVHNLIPIPLSQSLYPENISMAILNIRSLSGKMFLMNDLICEHKCDCMFLTET